MLTVEMQRNFLLKIKSLDRIDIKDMSSYDILFLLNQAQDILIDRLIAERKFDLLRPITLSSDVSTFVTTGVYDSGINGAKVVKLDDLTTYRTYLNSQSKLTRTAVPAATDVYMANKPVDKLEIFKFETNGTNKPIFTNPKEIIEGNYLIVLGDAYSTISHIIVIYVKTPTVLVISTPASDTSDLPSFLHQEIVDIAVQLARETVNINDLKK